MLYERQYNLTLAARPWVNPETMEPTLLVEVLHRERGERLQLGHIRQLTDGGCVLEALIEVKKAVENARILVQRTQVGILKCQYTGEVVDRFPKIECRVTLDVSTYEDFIQAQERCMLDAALMCARILAHRALHYKMPEFSFED